MKNKLILLTGSMALFIASDLTAQTCKGPQPNICVRSCWGARAPNCSLTPLSSLTRAIVHHTAGNEFNTTGLESSKSYMRGIQNYDMDVNGWCDFSYHFTVDKFGNLFEGRNGSMTSTPKAIHDTCNSAFGFTLLGYFHPPRNNVAPQIMLDRFYDVIAWRMPAGWSPYGSGNYCGKTVGVLDGHRKVTATACPGDLIHPNLITENYNGGTMRNSVAARRSCGPPVINPPYYFNSNTEGWTSGNNASTPFWEGCCGWPGILVSDQTGNDSFLYGPAANLGSQTWDISVNVSVYPQSGTTANHDMQLFWKTTAENSWSADKSSPIVTYAAQNSWIRLNLNASHAKWQGQTINQLRLDFDQANSGTRWIVNHIYNQYTPHWWFGSSVEGWTLGNGLTGLTWWTDAGWPGIMYADQTGTDAFFYSPGINYLGGANDVVKVRVFPQNGNTANHEMKVYWTTAGDLSWSESKSSQAVNFTAQNSWADVTIKVGAHPSWYSDFVKQIRLDVDGNTVNTGCRWIFDHIIIEPQTAQQISNAPVVVDDIIIDNPAATVVGTWTTASSAPDKYDADYRYRGVGGGTSYLQFTPTILTAGNYEVYEWHPAGSNRPTDAKHVITHSTGSATLNVNQQVGGGAWNLLGTYNFAAGTAGNIRITDGHATSGQVVMADAIKLVYVP